MKNCEFVEVPCPKGCNQNIEKKYLENHVKKECAKRTVTCQYCKTDVQYKNHKVALLNVGVVPLEVIFNGCAAVTLPLSVQKQRKCHIDRVYLTDENVNRHFLCVDIDSLLP